MWVPLCAAEPELVTAVRARIAQARDAAKPEAIALEGILDPFRSIQVDAAEQLCENTAGLGVQYIFIGGEVHRGELPIHTTEACCGQGQEEEDDKGS